MKYRRLGLLLPFLAAGLLAASCSSERDEQAPATIVTNAAVYTLDPDQPWAQAFAYETDGTIIAVGSEQKVSQRAGADAAVIDAGGRMVLPGFQDTHVHVPEAGINPDLCFMESGSSLAEYGRMAAQCAARQSDSRWVRAAGPSLFDLLDADELPIDVLDRAIPDRPALILDDLGHAVWTNSAGLEAAGIGQDDPDPQGGIIHRDPASGRLTGLLLENAQQRIRNVASPDGETTYAGLLAALAELARNGITSVSDAGGFWRQGHPEAWQRASREGTLTVRALNALYVYPDVDTYEQLAEFERRLTDNPKRLLRFNTAKIYVDGILDLGTAALLDRYDDPIDPDRPSGFLYFRPSQLEQYVSALHALGYRMNFHVIGDAATRAALDAVEAIEADPEEVAERRHRTTHTYLVHPDDADRFVELGVVADFQVGPEAIDPTYHEYLSEFVGDRAFDLIPVRRLLDTGAHVSLSSDWDADPLSPFGTIERALTRDRNAVRELETAIALVTIDAAYALSQEDTTGSIEVGKYADYVIIDQNLFEVDTDDIDRTEVLLTALGGRETYRSPRLER
ncbi:MAG: amidohydrolase [Gaiella sp.]